ncbi:MAG: hypothetical protein RL111_1248 [Pseudomonadota bacterium]|jgi:hypothetical protein
MNPFTIPLPTLEHVCDLAVRIDAPVEIGNTPMGLRRMIPITGGEVQGPLITGRVVPGGADYQLIVADGTLSHLDARYVIETHDGVRLVVFNTAIRYTTKENALRIMQGQAVDPAAVYFRCQPRMESTHAAYDWLNHTMMVGTGVRKPDGVFLSFYRY